MKTMNLINEKPSTPSKYEGLRAAMAAELMIGFWFGTEAILAVKMMNSLDRKSSDYKGESRRKSSATSNYERSKES